MRKVKLQKTYRTGVFVLLSRSPRQLHYLGGIVARSQSTHCNNQQLQALLKAIIAPNVLYFSINTGLQGNKMLARKTLVKHMAVALRFKLGTFLFLYTLFKQCFSILLIGNLWDKLTGGQMSKVPSFDRMFFWVFLIDSLNCSLICSLCLKKPNWTTLSRIISVLGPHSVILYTTTCVASKADNFRSLFRTASKAKRTWCGWL